MNIIRPEEYQERIQSIPPFQMHIVSYRLGDEFHCSVDNVDPGAVISRSTGSTRAEAESSAVDRATRRLEYSASRMNP
jgi:hypothetical protein